MTDGGAGPQILDRARAAQRQWATVSSAGRAKVLSPLAGKIAESIDTIAEVLHQENGKPRAEAIAHEAVAAIQLARHHCQSAPKVLRDQRVAMPALPHRGARIRRCPYGVVLAIAPWNLPFIIPFSQVLPALLAGNAVVLKPSELTPQSASLIFDLINSCDLPGGLLQVVDGDGQLGSALIDAQPDKVLFTGSVATGRSVMAACARFPIPVSLELGGVDAMIVRQDADLEFVASAATWGSTFNGGQACCSIERLLVHRSIHDRLVARIADKMARIDVVRDLGPAVDTRQFDVWHRQLADARARGLQFATGGAFGEGRRLEPTLLTGPNVQAADVWLAETFGPVLAAVPFDTDAEAIALHNATEFGLTASVFTADLKAAQTMAGQLRVGVVSINDVAATCYGSPELPWGGVGQSGFGRSHGEEGLLDVTWTQVIEAPRLPGNVKRPWWYPYGRDLEQTMTGLGQALATDQSVRRTRELAKAGTSVLGLLSRNPKL